MWTQDTTDLFVRRARQYQKRYPREVQGALVNVETYFTALKEGVKPIQIASMYGFVRSEGKDVYRVDQGKGQNKTQLRLYLYSDLENECLWLLTIGDKQSQKDDIKECHRLVDLIQESNKTEDKDEQHNPESEASEIPEEDGEIQ